MNTPKSALLAAVKRRARFSMVLFSLTLSLTRGQETPFSLRTSFCGAMTTRAVSFRSRARGTGDREEWVKVLFLSSLGGLFDVSGLGLGPNSRTPGRPAGLLSGCWQEQITARVRARGDRRRVHGLAADDRRPRRRCHRRGPRLRRDRGAEEEARAGERVPARGGEPG